MSTDSVDPRDFKSWEDAFQHPVPAVRRFEHQLRNNADENREKLRSLVGYALKIDYFCVLLWLILLYHRASYRNLLGTAERIIEMDDTMQQVEATISRLGQKCSSRAIERIYSSTTKLKSDNGDESS